MFYITGAVKLRNSQIFGVIIGVLFLGCDDDSKDLSVSDYSVYFFGNSITSHGPSEEIGWFGNWGMAASSEENDYVHKLIEKMKNEYKDYLRINYALMYIVNWEMNFSAELGTLEMDKIDLLIIRLGENVNEEYAISNNYYEALDGLIKRFKGKNTKVIVTDNYWPSVYKDNIQKEVAINNNYYFVQINDLYGNPENSAYRQFEHLGVATHPSDTGMEKIAERIFECIKENKIIK